MCTIARASSVTLDSTTKHYNKPQAYYNASFGKTPVEFQLIKLPLLKWNSESPTCSCDGQMAWCSKVQMCISFSS